LISLGYYVQNAKIDELQGIAKRKNAFLWDQKKNNTLTEFFPCLNSLAEEKCGVLKLFLITKKTGNFI